MEPDFKLIHDIALRTLIKEYYTNSGQNFGSKNISEKVDFIRDIMIQKLIDIIQQHQDTVNPKILLVIIMSIREIIYCVVRGITQEIISKAFQIRFRSVLAEVAATTFNCPDCNDDLFNCNWKSSDLFCLTCKHKIEVKSTYSILSENPIKLGDRKGVELFKKEKGSFIIFSYNKNPIFLGVNDWDIATCRDDKQPYLKIINEKDIKVYIPDFNKLFVASILKEFYDFAISIDELPTEEELQNINFTRENIPLYVFERSINLAYSEFKDMCNIGVASVDSCPCALRKSTYVNKKFKYKHESKSVYKCEKKIWVRGLSLEK
jgi:hypothetical protein